MCGLPSSGKTTWAEKTMSENRAKHYHLIGNEAIMDKMRICGQKREKYGNVHGTPFEVLQVNFWITNGWVILKNNFLAQTKFS